MDSKKRAIEINVSLQDNESEGGGIIAQSISLKFNSPAETNSPVDLDDENETDTRDKNK